MNGQEASKFVQQEGMDEMEEEPMQMDEGDMQDMDDIEVDVEQEDISD